MTALTNIEVTALNNLVAAKVAKTARDEAPVGEHTVDFTVRVTGTLKVLKRAFKAGDVALMECA